MNTIRYSLHDDVSFCRLEGGLVFLDIEKDQYFRLSRALEKSFLECADDDGHPSTNIDGLLERKILTIADASTRRLGPPAVEVPHSSLYESFPSERRLRVADLLEVSAIVGSMWAQLRFRSLKETLASLAVLRARSHRAEVTQPSIDLLRKAAHTFRRTRPFVPIKPRCLLDSLAMATFLARHDLHADIVFGVTGDPFSAHCWLQVGAVVVNDSVGNVDTYTPIRVI